MGEMHWAGLGESTGALMPLRARHAPRLRGLPNPEAHHSGCSRVFTELTGTRPSQRSTGGRGEHGVLLDGKANPPNTVMSKKGTADGMCVEGTGGASAYFGNRGRVSERRPTQLFRDSVSPEPYSLRAAFPWGHLPSCHKSHCKKVGKRVGLPSSGLFSSLGP